MENTIFTLLGLIITLGLAFLVIWGSQRLLARNDERGGGALLHYLILFVAVLLMIPLVIGIRVLLSMLF